MDKTTVSITFIVGGFFVVLAAVFVLSFFVPSLRFAPPKPHFESNDNATLDTPENRTVDLRKPSDLITPSHLQNYARQFQEVRVCSKKFPVVRSGPGPDYPESASSSLKKGQELYVVEEKNGWVKVRTTPDDRGTDGWIKKDQTAPREILPQFKGNLNRWTRLGLLLKVNPESNTAIVDPSQWAKLSDEAKSLFAEALATYCALESGTGEAWCQISDGNTGRSIATYRTHEGLREAP